MAVELTEGSFLKGPRRVSFREEEEIHPSSFEEISKKIEEIQKIIPKLQDDLANAIVVLNLKVTSHFGKKREIKRIWETLRSIEKKRIEFEKQSWQYAAWIGNHTADRSVFIGRFESDPHALALQRQNDLNCKKLLVDHFWSENKAYYDRLVSEPEQSIDHTAAEIETLVCRLQRQIEDHIREYCLALIQFKIEGKGEIEFLRHAWKKLKDIEQKRNALEVRNNLRLEKPGVIELDDDLAEDLSFNRFWDPNKKLYYDYWDGVNRKVLDLDGIEDEKMAENHPPENKLKMIFDLGRFLCQKRDIEFGKLSQMRDYEQFLQLPQANQVEFWNELSLFAKSFYDKFKLIESLRKKLEKANEKEAKKLDQEDFSEFLAVGTIEITPDRQLEVQTKKNLQKDLFWSNDRGIVYMSLKAAADLKWGTKKSLSDKCCILL